MTRRLVDFATGLAALAALTALLVVPPLLLVGLVGWPLPTTVPTVEGIEHAVRTGIDPHVIVNTLAVIAWVAWAQIALTITVETIALARNRTARPLRVLPGLQHSIGRLVATAALVVTSLLPTATATAAGPVSADAFAAYRTPTTLVVDRTTTTAAPAAASIPSHDADNNRPADTTATVTVEARDSYWAIAERVYGDGTRWREIRDHNVGRTMGDGTTITTSSEIVRVGWHLHLPTTPDLVDVDTGPLTGLDAEHTSPSPDAIPDTVAPADTVEVVSGDNFWNIAKNHLTDISGRQPTTSELTDYWLELIDANRDRLVTGDPNLIYPGQHLTLPATAHDPPAPAATATTPAAGDDPTAPAIDTEPPTPDPDPAPLEPVDANTDATVNGPVTGHPPPTSPPEATPLPPAAIEPAPTPTVVEASPTLDPPSAAADDGAGDRAGIIAAGIGALGIAGTGLGIGITRALRRRRLRANHLHPDITPLAEHDTDEMDVLRAAVIEADTDRHEELAAALDHLAATLATTNTDTRPRLVQHGTDHLDVLLTTAHTPATGGWHAEADGTIWTHPPQALDDDGHEPADARSTGWGPAAPLLVTLGQPDDTGSQLYLDLEAATVVCLTGDTDTAAGVARSVVTELAYSPLAERINLILVGDLHTHATERLDRITVVDTWDDVLDDLRAWADQSHRVHIQHAWANSFIARACHDHDALTPLVVIATTAPDDPDLLTRLATLTPAAVAVVAIAPAIDGATVVDCEPDQLTIRDLGLSCQPQTLTAATVDSIVGLLDHTDTPAGEPRTDTTEPNPTDTGTTADDPAELPEDAPSSNGDTPNEHDDAGAGSSNDVPAPIAPYADPEFEVLVRCLGDIYVEHPGDKSLTAKQTATVACIALHQPVSIDRLEDAVWTAPTSGPRRKRLANTVSDCRSILGARNLPVATGDGHYTTATTVVTDLDLFDRRVAHAATQPAADAIDTLRGALALVTGPVFTYRSTDRHSYTWVDLDNWVARWEPKIAGVAQHLAQLCMDNHQPTDAIEVATHALGIVPTHTGLTETLMRAHHHNSDPTSVDAVYRAHAAALEQLGIDDVADSTAELYDQLRRTRATTG